MRATRLLMMPLCARDVATDIAAICRRYAPAAAPSPLMLLIRHVDAADIAAVCYAIIAFAFTMLICLRLYFRHVDDCRCFFAATMPI